MTLSSIGVMTGISDTRDDGAHLATDWGWFLAWLLVGACAGVGLAAILTVGAAFLVLAAVAAVLLIRKGPGRAAVGAVAGLALPAFYLAYLNRGGPGEVCRTVTGGQSCTDDQRRSLALLARASSDLAASAERAAAATGGAEPPLAGAGAFMEFEDRMTGFENRRAVLREQLARMRQGKS